ncbi:MAG: Fe-S cluster assembly protein SufD [Elusimicrobia bacterium]|nr:Fe-S cluster assembly protein SufD [Elusimicrobiota bacterium]
MPPVMANTITPLKKISEEAGDLFARLSWPAPNNELYKRTDLSLLRNGFTPEAKNCLTERSEHLTGLHEFAEDHPGLIEEKLGRLIPAARGKLEAMNMAQAQDGIVLHLPEGRTLDTPIFARFHCSGKTNAAFFTRNLILLGRGSRATLIEDWSGESSTTALTVGATEIYLEEDAELNYVVIQNLGDSFHSFAYEAAHVAAGARLHLFHLETGGAARRLDIAADAAGPNAQSRITGAVLGHGRQNFDTVIIQRHQAPHTASDMLWKSALWGRSRSSFYGLIKIEQGANGTEAYQTANNLLLSQDAQAIPDPRLEILADDVRAKHAATVGHLDEEQKFYLMSRGLNERDAEHILTAGFMHDTAGRLPENQARWTVAAQLEKMLVP